MVDCTCQVLKIVAGALSGVRDNYVDYIDKWEEKLELLHKTLSELCNLRDEITKRVEEGENKQAKMSATTAAWLRNVKQLCVDKKLIQLMQQDIKTAKLVVRMMGKNEMETCIGHERKMKEVVLKVMKQLKEDMKTSEEEMREMAEVDYDNITQVMVEMIMDCPEELKILIKADERVAKIATRKLPNKSLEALTIGDPEMEEIVTKARYETSTDDDDEEEELLPDNTNEDSNAAPTAAAKESIIRLGDWLIHVKQLMENPGFKKAVPKSEIVKVCLDIMGGLWIDNKGLKQGTQDNINEQNTYCYRYNISKAAHAMTTLVKGEFIEKIPRGDVTCRESAREVKPIPSNSLKGLESRTNLLKQTMDLLIDDRVQVVGLFGMGGIGKTTMAKDINYRAYGYGFKVIKVDVSETPDISQIQATIAASLGPILNGMENVTQRAGILINRLNRNKKKGWKTLVILDDVWKKLNLTDIGIPEAACKLLVVARDKNVCRVMGAKDSNILMVDLINSCEARLLLKSQTGSEVDMEKYTNVVDRVLSKCGGLPLAIVTRADALRNRDFGIWENNAKSWEKPISSHKPSHYQDYSTILGTSYKSIKDEKQRMFFLLACLFTLSSNVPIETLMRYGIGLRLFEQVSNLLEAIDKANEWADELVSSSILLEGDVKGRVKVHALVRACAIFFAAKAEKHNFLVDAIPGWMGEETISEYTAMSLKSSDDFSILEGVDMAKLQIMKVKGDVSPSFTNSFFERMSNLLVLDMSNMNFHPSLPDSIWELKSLRTLCLEGCKLGDISKVVKLVKLLVLSLRGSFVEEIPNGIVKLRRLVLLDLTGCTSNKVPLIPADVISKLCKLERLYGVNTRQTIIESATENYRRSYLNALEIEEPEGEEQAIACHSAQQLDKFTVCVEAN